MSMIPLPTPDTPIKKFLYYAIWTLAIFSACATLYNVARGFYFALAPY
jgi:hypothetical protein